MILNELFDTTVPFEMTLDGGFFKIDQYTYGVDFLFMNDTSAQVSFSMDKPSTNYPGTSSSHYGVEGTGNELKVFATVIAIIKQFIINNPQITYIEFSAKSAEPSRVRLYDRMVKSLANGWDIQTTTYEGDKVYKLFKPTERNPAPPSEDVPF